MFYTIQNDSLLIAENKDALARFYGNVQKLPDDYEVGKYVIEDCQLVLNPDYKKILDERNKMQIMQKLQELDLKSIRAIRANETEFINKYEYEAQKLREQLT